MPIPDLLGLTDEIIKTYKAIGLYQAVRDDAERGDPIGDAVSAACIEKHLRKCFMATKLIMVSYR
jgi:hypothetical protein